MRRMKGGGLAGGVKGVGGDQAGVHAAPNKVRLKLGGVKRGGQERGKNEKTKYTLLRWEKKMGSKCEGEWRVTRSKKKKTKMRLKGETERGRMFSQKGNGGTEVSCAPWDTRPLS